MYAYRLMHFRSKELEMPKYHYIFRAMLNPKKMIVISKWHYCPHYVGRKYKVPVEAVSFTFHQV